MMDDEAIFICDELVDPPGIFFSGPRAMSEAELMSGCAKLGVKLVMFEQLSNGQFSYAFGQIRPWPLAEFCAA